MSTKYKLIDPPSHLGGIIKNYFVFEGDAKTYNLFHFADFNSKLFFVRKGLVGFCKSDNILKTKEHDGRVVRTRNALELRPLPVALLGPCNSCCCVSFQGEVDIVGVEFQPTGIWHLLGESAACFADTLAPLCDDIVAGIGQLSSYIGSCRRAEDAIAAISVFFSGKEVVSSRDADNIRLLMDSISKFSFKNRIADMADILGVTVKQLQRLCKLYVGISPVRISHITRFKSVLRQLKEGCSCSELQEVSDSEHFFDKAHFAKDIKRLSGHTPNVLNETGFKIRRIQNMAVVYEDDEECTFCIYSC